MKLGCHAVLYTDRIASETTHVLELLAASECRGVEIGARFFGVEKSAELKKMLELNGLELCGLHVGTSLTGLLDNPVSVGESVDKACEFLKAMPNKNIIMSGVIPEGDKLAPATWDSRLTEPASVRSLAEVLQKIAEKALLSGVQIHYHNHNWELLNDGLIFHALAEYAPGLKFGLDTGWVEAAGVDCVGLIERYTGRFGYVHLRDYDKSAFKRAVAFKDLQESFVEIGRGDMDFPRLLRCLKSELGTDGWAVIEYETGAVDHMRHVKAVSYLKGLLRALD